MVLEMLAEQKGMAQASREYGIKDSVLSRWKKEFVAGAAQIFAQGQAQDDRDQKIAELERMVGRLAMELDAVKKVSSILSSR